jgi:DNA-binding NarL/FixJ family response regulator
MRRTIFLCLLILFVAAVHPDLVLMDISMPELDGIMATRAFYEIDPTARIVIVSENDSPSFRNAARQAGALWFVSKGNLFDLESVLEKLSAS